MVFQTFIRAPHSFCLASILRIEIYALLTSLLFFVTNARAQQITGLEVARSIEHQNYGVSALDVYFVDGHQLIAYSNNSGSSNGDTLVIYDFAADEVLSSIPGVNWSYDISFINADQLLFRNGDKLYRVVNFNTPVITEIATGVRAFAVTENEQTVAVLKAGGPAFIVEISAYNSNTGVLSPPDTHEIADQLQTGESKLVFSPDGNYLGINGGYEGDFVVLINTNNGDVATVMTSDNHGTYSPAFCNQGGMLLLAVGGGYQNGSIELIDVEALQLETSIPVFPNYNYALDFDPLEEYVVTGGYDGIIKIFRVNGTDYDEVAMIPSLNVNRLQFTQDNMYVVSGEGPSPARLVIYRILRGPSSVSGSNISSIKMYPNPADDILHFEGLDEEVISIQSINGQRIIEKQLHSSQLDIRRFESGLYVVRCLNDGVVYAMKFFKS